METHARKMNTAVVFDVDIIKNFQTKALKWNKL